MPRRPRVVIEGGIYHVYNRFARGAEVLREGDEADRFLDLLRMVRDQSGAWPNEFHTLFDDAPVLHEVLGLAPFSQSTKNDRSSTGTTSAKAAKPLCG